MILVDTDVLIWVTRKDPQASAFLDSLGNDLAISDVTYMDRAFAPSVRPEPVEGHSSVKKGIHR